MTGHYGRYLVGWAVTAGLLLLALTVVFPGVAGDGPRAVVPAIALAALTDLAVYALVLRALDADARRFSRLWGLSMGIKVVAFGSAIVAVDASGWFPTGAFVRVLIVSFVAFSHHEIVCLLVRKDRPGVRPC